MERQVTITRVYVSPRRDAVVALSRRGLSKREIARLLGVSRDTVKKHLQRARDVGELGAVQ